MSEVNNEVKPPEGEKPKGDASQPKGDANEPVTPPADDLKAKIAEKDAELDRLRKANTDKENDLKKTRDQRNGAIAALKAGGLMADDQVPDAKKVEDERREREVKSMRFENTLTKAILASNLSVKDNDPDLIAFKIGRDPKLKAFADAEDAPGLIKALTESNLLLEKAVAPAGAVKPAESHIAQAINLQQSPDPAAAAIKTFPDLMRKPWDFVEKFKKDHPTEYAQMERDHEMGGMFPQRRKTG